MNKTLQIAWYQDKEFRKELRIDDQHKINTLEQRVEYGQEEILKVKLQIYDEEEYEYKALKITVNNQTFNVWYVFWK